MSKNQPTELSLDDELQIVHQRRRLRWTISELKKAWRIGHPRLTTIFKKYNVPDIIAKKNKPGRVTDKVPRDADFKVVIWRVNVSEVKRLTVHRGWDDWIRRKW